jgi:hypothetical protein
MERSITRTVLRIAGIALMIFPSCGKDNRYEVIERTQKDNVPDFQGTGTGDRLHIYVVEIPRSSVGGWSLSVDFSECPFRALE